MSEPVLKQESWQIRGDSKYNRVHFSLHISICTCSSYSVCSLFYLSLHPSPLHISLRQKQDGPPPNLRSCCIYDCGSFKIDPPRVIAQYFPASNATSSVIYFRSLPLRNQSCSTRIHHRSVTESSIFLAKIRFPCWLFEFVPFCTVIHHILHLIRT